MKSVWTGSIGFGLVNIPVKLYSAVQDSSLDFDMLDRKDHAKIRFKRVNERTGKEVPWEGIAKAFMVNDKYVVLSEEDFERASPENTKTIEITQFVNATEINANYFELPYYVEPDKSGARAYTLLKDALKKTGKAGVGSFIMREREHLCVVREQDGILILNKIRFAQELRPAKEIKVPVAKPKPQELKMAVNLINQLTTAFDISSYKDEYSAKLMKVIRQKSKGALKPYQPMKVVYSKTEDLMAQLKASLDGGKRKKAS